MKKKFKFILAAAALVIAVAGIYFLAKRSQEKKLAEAVSNPQGVWEVMVVLRDQQSGADPSEDQKSSLKRGDVISVRPLGHAWAYTEYISYLLVKIDGKRSEVDKLLLPLEKESGEKDKEGNKIMETVLPRKYRVDIAKTGFSGDSTLDGQPLENKVFGTDIIVDKNK